MLPDIGRRSGLTALFCILMALAALPSTSLAQTADVATPGSTLTLEEAVALARRTNPDFLQQAALFNIEKFFGWVSSVADFKGAFGQIPPGS